MQMSASAALQSASVISEMHISKLLINGSATNLRQHNNSY